MSDQNPEFINGAWVIDPHELAEALRLMNRVLAGEEKFKVLGYRMAVRGDDGQVNNVQVEDTPLNRVLLALKEWYHEEPVEHYLSVCLRLFSLNKLIRAGALEEWVSVNPQSEETHIGGAVIYAAAVVDLRDREGFDLEEFLAAAREFDRREG